MTLAYAVTNALAGLANSAFTWSGSGPNDTTRGRLNDGRMDSLFSAANASGGVTCVINMGSAVSLSGFAICNSNIALAGGTPTLRVRAATDSGISAGVITPKAATTLSTTAPKQKDHVLQFAATAAKQYWELTWTWTGNYTFTVGELFAYTASTQLSRAGIYGSGEGEFYRNAQVDMASGERRAVFLAGPVRRLSLKWKDLTSTQLAELRTLWRATRGPVTPFLFIQSYEAVSTAAAAAEQEVLYARLLLDAYDFTQPDFNLYDPPDLVISSLGREAGG